MILDSEDNKILWDIMTRFNNNVPLGEKITLDVYINRIELGEDIMIYGVGMTPLIPDGYKIDNVGSKLMGVGEKFEMNVNLASEDIRNILRSFIREMKLKNVLN